MLKGFNTFIWLMSTLLFFTMGVIAVMAEGALEEGTASGSLVVVFSKIFWIFSLPFARLMRYMDWDFLVIYGYLFDVALYGLLVDRLAWMYWGKKERAKK